MWLQVAPLQKVSEALGAVGELLLLRLAMRALRLTLEQQGRRWSTTHILMPARCAGAVFLSKGPALDLDLAAPAPHAVAQMIPLVAEGLVRRMLQQTAVMLMQREGCMAHLLL